MCQTYKLETEDEVHHTKCIVQDTLFAKMKSKDNFDDLDKCKLSQEMLFPKLINPARKIITEIVKFISDCLEKRTQAISAIASNSYM